MSFTKKDYNAAINKAIAELAQLREQMAQGETTYQVQNQDVQQPERWHDFSTATANRTEALTKANEMRERYNKHTDGAWRVVQTTSLTTLIY